MVLNFLFLHTHKNAVGRFYRDHHTLSNRTDKLSSRQRPHNPEPCSIRAIAPDDKILHLINGGIMIFIIILFCRKLIFQLTTSNSKNMEIVVDYFRKYIFNNHTILNATIQMN